MNWKNAGFAVNPYLLVKRQSSTIRDRSEPLVIVPISVQQKKMMALKMAKSKTHVQTFQKGVKVTPFPTHTIAKSVAPKRSKPPKKKAISKKKENRIANRRKQKPPKPKNEVPPPIKNYEIIEKPQIKEKSLTTTHKPIFLSVEEDEEKDILPIPLAFIIAGSETIRKKIRLDKIISEVRKIRNNSCTKPTLKMDDQTMGMKALSDMFTKSQNYN